MRLIHTMNIYFVHVKAPWILYIVWYTWWNKRVSSLNHYTTSWVVYQRDEENQYQMFSDRLFGRFLVLNSSSQLAMTGCTLFARYRPRAHFARFAKRFSRRTWFLKSFGGSTLLRKIDRWVYSNFEVFTAYMSIYQHITQALTQTKRL